MTIIITIITEYSATYHALKLKAIGQLSFASFFSCVHSTVVVKSYVMSAL